MTSLTGRALRLTVYIGEDDTWHHKPLYSEIVHRAHAAGLAGASVFRGIEASAPPPASTPPACCRSARTCRSRWSWWTPRNGVRAFLPQLDELVREGLVTLDDCEVVRYVGRAAGQDPAGSHGEGSP